MSDNAIARAVTMYQNDWAVVEAVAHTKDYLFDGNISQALRYIVRDWARRQRQQAGLRIPQEELDAQPTC